MEKVDIKTIHQDLVVLKKEIGVIKHILEEGYELSDEAKKELAEARATDESEYINQEEIEKRIL